MKIKTNLVAPPVGGGMRTLAVGNPLSRRAFMPTTGSGLNGIQQPAGTRTLSVRKRFPNAR